MVLAGLLSACGGSTAPAKDTCRVGSCADLPQQDTGYDPGNVFPDIGNPDVPAEDPGVTTELPSDASVEAEVAACPGSFGCECDSNDQCYSQF